jgi:hypothetical protein
MVLSLVPLLLPPATSRYIEVDNLFEGVDFTTTLTRAKFESLVQDQFQKTIVQVKRAMRDAELTVEEIHEVGACVRACVRPCVVQLHCSPPVSLLRWWCGYVRALRVVNALPRNTHH